METTHPTAGQYPPVKARFKKEIADEMGYSIRTFQRRLKEAEVQIPRGLISPELQQEIFQKLGWNPG
ncbi:MAG: hypothetical protein KA165_07405 [Saprospiraceae bacterium]|nr:hypothetical protein [Saprospiraceae bacterium]